MGLIGEDVAIETLEGDRKDHSWFVLPSEKSSRLRMSHGEYECLEKEGAPIKDTEQELVPGSTERIRRGGL